MNKCVHFEDAIPTFTHYAINALEKNHLVKYVICFDFLGRYNWLMVAFYNIYSERELPGYAALLYLKKSDMSTLFSAK